jgi:TolA-binding protein
MSTAAISSNSIPQQAQQYFHQRSADLQKLGQALESGDTAAAQQEFSAITSLGQKGPVSGGNSFFVSQRQTDFDAIGQALQNGDLTSAQQAFVQLQNSFPQVHSNDPTADSVSLSPAATASGSGVSVTA